MTQEKIFQFKIILQDINPPVWRRIQISSLCSFWDLHIAIQNAMGWKNKHLHEFEVLNPNNKLREETISIPYDTNKTHSASWKKQVSDYISLNNNSMIYTYDFGDNWQHLVKLEEICDKQSNQKYPVCLDGARACPPEDIGGSYGYEELLDILSNTEHSQHNRMMKLVEGDIQLDHFDPDGIKFADPKKVLKNIKL